MLNSHLEPEEYNKMRRNGITPSYKKAKGNIKKIADEKGKEIVKKSFDNNGKMDVNAKSNCFIIVKGHKKNFLNHPKVRLINPANNQLGKISKTTIVNVNMKLFETTKINELKNTQALLNDLIC